MNNQGMLKNAILSKSLFTMVTGLGLVVVAPIFSGTLNVNHASLTLMGMCMALMVSPDLFLCSRNWINDRTAKAIIIKDILMITLCFTVMVFNMMSLGAAALSMMGIFASVFSVNTYMQHNSLRKMIEMEAQEEAHELRVVYIDAA